MSIVSIVINTIDTIEILTGVPLPSNVTITYIIWKSSAFHYFIRFVLTCTAIYKQLIEQSRLKSQN